MRPGTELSQFLRIFLPTLTCLHSTKNQKFTLTETVVDLKSLSKEFHSTCSAIVLTRGTSKVLLHLKLYMYLVSL